MRADIGSLVSKVNAYSTVLDNTIKYRSEWHANIKPFIKEVLVKIMDQTKLKGEVKIQDKMENLESILLDLGRTSSGISENLEDSGVKRTMIKTNGALIYQQLFNGKIMVMIISPMIEGYGEAKSPKTVEILRPEELTEALIINHVEMLLKDIIAWEDFDDDEPNRPPNGFQPIGFNREDVEQAP
jgi:predicted ATP-dependent Lon-type protease